MQDWPPKWKCWSFFKPDDFTFHSLTVNTGCKFCCQPAHKPSRVCWTDSFLMQLWAYDFSAVKRIILKWSTEYVKGGSEVPVKLWFLAWRNLPIIRICVQLWFLLFHIILFSYSSHGFITWQVLITDFYLFFNILLLLFLSKKDAQGLTVAFYNSWLTHYNHSLKTWDEISILSPLSALLWSWLSSGTKIKPMSSCMQNPDSGFQMLLSSWQSLASKRDPFYTILNI